MIAFITVAFGQVYIEQQKRLIPTIQQYHKNGKIYCYTNKLPEGAIDHNKSLYGFKVHAIQQAINDGYKKIIYLDTAMIVKDNMEFYFDLCKDYGAIAIQDDSKLPSSDMALNYFGYTRDQIKDFHLVGGSMFVFDMDYSELVFRDWYNAEKAGIFGSQHDEAVGQLQGHRHDETCFAFSLYKNGFKPLPYSGSRYNWDSNPAIIKDHFK